MSTFEMVLLIAPNSLVIDATRDCVMMHTEAPICPGKLYNDALGDDAHEITMTACKYWMDVCDNIVVYYEDGVTALMKAQLNYASEIGREIERRKLPQ